MTVNDEAEFRQQCHEEINAQASNQQLQSLTRQWVDESIKSNYSYHFEWLGRPIIQYPQDIVAMQQLLWSVQPDLVIETGIARGGSLIFYASILELIAQCGGPKHAKILGIDIDIRAHNGAAVESHPMAKRIDMIEGSSIDPAVVNEVKAKAETAQTVLVCLDSNHSHDHVLAELHAYAPLVTQNSYLVVFDTLVEDVAGNLIKNRPWSKGNNPKTAVFEFLKQLENGANSDPTSNNLKFEIDDMIEHQILITVAPSGYLKRV